MPGILARSKSLRFLKNTRRDATGQENGDSMPPLKSPQTGFEKYQPTIHESGAEEKLGAPNMAVRPSTSGGPGERPMMFHRKTNPTPSVFSQDVVHSFQSPTSSTTVLYTTDVTKEQGVIGIALGSPSSGSHFNSTPQNAGFKTNPRFPNSSMANLRQPNGSSPSLNVRQEAPKSKLSRWKSMFRKAAPPPPEKPSFYQLAQTATSAPRADSHHEEEVQEPQAPAKPEREAVRTVSPPAYKPNIRASRKWARGEFIAPESPPETSMTRERALTLGNSMSHHRPNMSIQRAFTTPNPVPRSTPNESSSVTQVVASTSISNNPTADPAVPALDGGPLLDISLPDITLERYSVMFRNLLQSEPSRSSLLVRRQGNADKLLPLNALSTKGNTQESPIDYSLQRRATSPTPASSSPRLSLFPSTNPSRAPSVMNRSKKDLKRSRTVPAKSPLQQTSQDFDEKAKKSDSGKLKPAASPYLQPALTPTSICSFESEAESITIIVAQASPGYPTRPFKVHLDEREPEWEILSKPVLKTARSEILLSSSAPISPLIRSPSQKQPKVTKLSALSSHPSSAPLDAPSPLHASPLHTPSPLQRLQSLSTPPHSAGLKRAEIQARRKEAGARVEEVGTAKAMVGVARSVSVSRANSPRAIVRTMTSPMEDRLGSGLALTPTMVEVRNRKSQRVQLVDA